MPDAARGDQAVRNLADLSGSAPQHNNLQAVVMIQVHVQGRYDLVEMLMLHVDEFVIDQTLMVVVDQSQRPHHGLIVLVGLFFNQSISNQIADGFGAVGIALPCHQLVKLLEQTFGDRDPNAGEIIPIVERHLRSKIARGRERIGAAKARMATANRTGDIALSTYAPETRPMLRCQMTNFVTHAMPRLRVEWQRFVEAFHWCIRVTLVGL